MNGFESYGFPDGKRYNSFVGYFKRKYGERLQKIVLDAGFTCPNRDGTIGTGGCIFCSEGGSGDFAGNRNVSIASQIEEGKALVEKKHTGSSYIAYFQAYSNTYGPIEKLKEFDESIEDDTVTDQDMHEIAKDMKN